MKFSVSLLPLAGAALLFSGCVGTGPRTQEGAVNGALLGAIAGAVIGHNSGDSAGEGAILGAAAGAILGGTLGNKEDHEQGTIYRSESEARTDIVVTQPPPPPARPSEVMTVQPSTEMVWVAGFWRYTGQEYLWVRGRWEIPPPNCSGFVSPHWQRRGGGYSYVQGYWY